jgi:hypothetical protein
VNDDDSTGSIAVALAGLKGAVDTGFATLNGQLNVALEKQYTTDREIKDLKGKLAQLEAKMWKLSMMAALIGGGGATGAYQVMG